MAAQPEGQAVLAATSASDEVAPNIAVRVPTDGRVKAAQCEHTPYPAFSWRDSLASMRSGLRMRRRGVHSRSFRCSPMSAARALKRRARRIGALVAEPAQANLLETTLRTKGWILGGNLQIEFRITRGDTNLTQAYARELLSLQPDVLFAVTNTSMAALYAEHSNIPTVFAMVSDPVGMHYVESFSRPGGQRDWLYAISNPPSAVNGFR